MKKKARMIGLMAVMICLVAGCGAKKEEEGKTNNYGINSETEESNETAEIVSDAETIPEKQSAERETVQELKGIVTRIEENRVTIIIGGEYQEDREGQGDIQGEVDVYVDDSTVYELQELSNEGAVVKSRESSFDEIQKDESLLRVIGHWTETSFYAEKIVNRKLAN